MRVHSVQGTVGNFEARSNFWFGFLTPLEAFQFRAKGIIRNPWVQGRKVLPLYWSRMDVERVIDDIEQLEEMFEAPDIRPLSASDISAANRRHDEQLAHSPWFRLWQDYGVCCRPEAPVIQVPE